MTKEKRKNKVVVKTDYCKGCHLCVAFCKKEVLKVSENLNKMGYHYVEPREDVDCTGCMVCAMICPDVVIEVYEDE
ncbi:MAG: ferredoxin family protein [bacterium]|nr:ferredoxin family protein [bacterium]